MVGSGRPHHHQCPAPPPEDLGGVAPSQLQEGLVLVLPGLWAGLCPLQPHLGLRRSRPPPRERAASGPGGGFTAPAGRSCGSCGPGPQGLAFPVPGQGGEGSGAD